MENNMETVIRPFHKSIVQPHLECYVQFWASHLKKEIAELDGVQRLAARMTRAMAKWTGLGLRVRA